MDTHKLILILSASLVAAMAALILVPQVAHAGDVTLTSNITVEDETGCDAIGGEWRTADPGCTLSSSSALTVSHNVSVTVGNLAILNNGAIHVGGTIVNNGLFTNYGTIDNGRMWDSSTGPGTIINNHTFTNYGAVPESCEYEQNCSLDIENNASGMIRNYGEILLDWTDFLNLGAISNEGQIRIQGMSAGLINFGSIDNEGQIYIDIWSGGIFNWDVGTIRNFGAITNNGGLTSQGAMTNGGAFTNNAYFSNEGAFTNTCVATYIGDAPQGNPMEQSLCCYLPSVIR